MNEPTSEAADSAESVDRLRAAAIRAEILQQESRNRNVSPVRRIEIASLLLIIGLCDLTIYRGEGFAGYGALITGLPVLLLTGMPSRNVHAATWLSALLVAGAAVRLVWCGSTLGLVCGLIVVNCFAMSLAGRTPHLVHSAVFASQLFASGYRGLHHYWASLCCFRPPARIQNVLAIILPVVALVVFGMLFVFANPDLAATVSARLKELVDAASSYLPELIPDGAEVLFCIAAGWIAVGLLRPVLPDAAARLEPDCSDASVIQHSDESDISAESSSLFEAYRNTLIVVTSLFAAYLVFEFQTLWFREFPEGFHYSGYAHEGAAWLTVALALATVMLSLMLRGTVLADRRVNVLRKLSWFWSLENVILALAVYNRLSIYIAFNGMTRMRTIGLLGITSVLIGFLLVVRKTVKGHDFRWLLRRQLWTVALAVYLYAVLPVDAFVMRHNVNRVLNGDLSPSVQIIAHPTTSEGLLQLTPLLDCQDSKIQQGVRALLAYHQLDQQHLAVKRAELGWTSRQIADEYLLEVLDGLHSQLAEYSDRARRESAIEQFREHAWQWY